MTFWTVYTLIFSAAALVTLGIPLRATDYGQNGHIVHYHRDTLSGGHLRHIHHRPTVKRSHQTYRDSYFQKLGSPVNPAAIYEVPSNRHYNAAQELQLRSLVEKTYSENNSTSDVKSDNGDSGDNNGKHDNNNNEAGIHSVQNRDAPTPPSEAHAHTHDHFLVQTLPHGLQFLNRHSQGRRHQNPVNSISDPSTGMALDLNTLLGETIESTTPPTTPSDVYISTASSLDLGFLLGDLGTKLLGNQGHDNSNHAHGHQDHGHGHHVQSHGHEHGHGVHSHAHNTIHDKPTETKSSRRLGNTLMGMFNHHGSHGVHGDHIHQEVITLPSTNTVPSRQLYQNSTQHARPITKRGVMDSDSVSRFPKTFIDNILNIRIMRTTPPPAVIPTTQPTRYSGYLTTSRLLETQIERLSGINLKRVRENNREFVRNSALTGRIARQRTTAKPKIAAPSEKELVHLQGIHIMFSDGKQDNGGQIPTVHLTAAVSDNMNHLIQIAGGGSQGSREPKNISQITDKITGTAVIRDGHLYLVVYPFGNNKSLELHYNETTKRIPLPRNKPVSISDSVKPSARPDFSSSISNSVKPTIPAKTVSSTRLFSSVKPTVEASLSSTSYVDPHSSHRADMSSTSHRHSHPSKPGVSNNAADNKGSHQHVHHHHHHHHHDSSTPSLTGLKLAEVNDTTLQTLLAPIDRFVSPWNSLNFSKVFPYSAGINTNNTSSKKALDEDSEVDVVTFIAKATDPFNRMKDIIQTLVNKTLLNVSSTPTSGNKTETKFNFELKLESGNVQNINNKKQTTANPNNSEENTIDTNVNLTTQSSKTNRNINRFEKVTDAMPITTVKTLDLANNGNIFTNGRSSGENTTPSKQSFNNIGEGNNLETTIINLPGGGIKTTPITRYRDNSVNSPDARISGSIDKSNSVKHDIKDKLNADPNVDRLLHFSEHIALTTTKGISKDFHVPRTTLTYIPNYTKSSFEKQPSYQITTPSLRDVLDNRNTIHRNKPTSSQRKTVLGSNLQPFVQRTSPNRFRQGLNRGQSEQIISLADILNDIRRIQLHNMQRFNIQNNNFDTMILSETQQKPVRRQPILVEAPLIQQTSGRRFSDFPAASNNNNNIQKQKQQQKLSSGTQATTPVTQKRFGRQAVDDNSFEAMLVLSVDDIMTDHTDMHGAIVISHRRRASSTYTK